MISRAWSILYPAMSVTRPAVSMLRLALSERAINSPLAGILADRFPLRKKSLVIREGKR
jgi:hypothetical protein